MIIMSLKEIPADKVIKKYFKEADVVLSLDDRVVKKEISIDNKKCLSCNICVEVCPIGVIESNIPQSPIIGDKCIYCSTCVDACPVDAIDVLNGSVNINNDNVVYNLNEKEIEHRTVKLKKYNIDLENCIKCGICARYCPTNAITVVRRESFEVDLNKCVGCKACENVCPKKVINVENELGELPFKKDIKVDNDVCVKCLACIDECPVGIISEISEGVEIDKSNCIFCGRCENVCPVHAIKISSKK